MVRPNNNQFKKQDLNKNVYILFLFLGLYHRSSYSNVMQQVCIKHVQHRMKNAIKVDAVRGICISYVLCMAVLLRFVHTASKLLEMVWPEQLAKFENTKLSKRKSHTSRIVQLYKKGTHRIYLNLSQQEQRKIIIGPAGYNAREPGITMGRYQGQRKPTPETTVDAAGATRPGLNARDIEGPVQRKQC